MSAKVHVRNTDTVNAKIWKTIRKEAMSEHCRDCCCARSWEALGIKSYTGRSIPEEIGQLRAAAAEAFALLRELVQPHTLERARMRAAGGAEHIMHFFRVSWIDRAGALLASVQGEQGEGE
jgi:hypothetical protein